MKFFSTITSLKAVALSTLLFTQSAVAERIIYSTSLDACPGFANQGVSATLFNVALTPDNRTLQYNINGEISISEKVIVKLQVQAYGINVYTDTIDPCNAGASFSQLCPATPGALTIDANNQNLSLSILNKIPGIAYYVPDIDAVATAQFYNYTNTSMEVACVQVALSNGKTVDLQSVKWVTAVLAGLFLAVAGLSSGLGHTSTAAHLAANALSLFGYFQSQAVWGMTAVHLPPIYASWTQDFQWSMGIVNIGFMQTVLTWYQRATGGTPSTILTTLGTDSVQVQKRSLDVVSDLVGRGFGDFVKRDTNLTYDNAGTIVRGIERVGFNESIEPTNIFLTSIGMFVCFAAFVVILVGLFRGFCELAVRMRWVAQDRFSEFRNGWRIILKGILFRVVLLGYAPIVILCLWEFTVRDSAAEVVTAVFYFLTATFALVWAALKVVRIAKRSVNLHKNPAYILYSDPAALNKWGFLYVQFRATAYYFILPQLIYIFIKGAFVAFAQGAWVAQAIGLLIIEALWLITVCVLRPWMDKKTNSFNISIAVFNLFTAICVLIFSNVFNQSQIANGILGVVVALANAIFALVLLILLIIASAFAIFSKNPDNRYQPMRDDRQSFIKSASQSHFNTELDALGMTARGDGKFKNDVDEDTVSLSSGSVTRRQMEASQMPLPMSRDGSHVYDAPHSPGFGSTASLSRSGTPTQQWRNSGYSNVNRSAQPQNNTGAGRTGMSQVVNSDNYGGEYNRASSMNSQAGAYKPNAGYGNGTWNRGY